MKRALIVEDDPVWGDLLSEYCQKEGFEAVLAISPQGAMNLLDGHKFNVVILDMLLAVETGMVLLNEMRSYGDLSKIPIIVCTSSDLSLGQLSPFGVSAVLDKSAMDAKDLGVELRRLLV